MYKKLLRATVIGLCSTLFILFLQTFKILAPWEYTTWSWRVQELAHTSIATKKIKLILLDQKSLDWGVKENGLSWPWPREMYKPLLNFCRRGGAKVFVFDVLYTEPSFYGMEDDQLFAQAITQSPVVLPMLLGLKKQTKPLQQDTINRINIDISGLSEWQNQSIKKTSTTLPILKLAHSAKILGYANEKPDMDGVFRRVSLFHTFNDEIIPSLGLAAYLLQFPNTLLSIDSNHFFLDNKKFDINSSGQVVLRYYGDLDAHQTFSAAAIIQAELNLQQGKKSLIDPNQFKDSTVFFGFSASGLKDLRATPISVNYPGVGIHATLLNNLLQQETIKNTPLEFSIPLIFLLAVIASFLITLSHKALQTALNFIVFILIMISLGFIAYNYGYWWPLVQGLITVILALISSIILNYAIEGRQQRFLRSAFKYYLSDQVINQLLHNPERLKLGGEKRELSIFFSDIQGFTSLSEKLEAEQLVDFLNDYLTDLTDIIMQEGGTLDKFEGDAIIAFWNAPVNQPDHAIRICRAALRCQQKLAERREEFFQRTGFLIVTRIGIHTGTAVVGNIGSTKRFDYTVIGDAVNLASRLEGANKVFGTQTMVSEVTWSIVQDQFIGREIATLRVVGRKTPTTVYELIGFKEHTVSNSLQTYQQALEFYKQGQWNQALEIFEQLENDLLSQTYALRCKQLIKNNASINEMIWNLDEK